MFILCLVTANLTHLDDSQAENATRLQAAGGNRRPSPLLHMAALGRVHAHPPGLLRGPEATCPSPVPRTSLEDDFCLELPKSWVPLGTKLCSQQVILSLGSATEQPGGPGAQGRRSFLRSLCPTWDPRRAAFTRPLNCPCSFTFFLWGQGTEGSRLTENRQLSFL